MNFENMIKTEETHLGITLGNKERLLVDNLLRDMLVTSIKTIAPIEAKLQVATDALEGIYIESFGEKELRGLTYEEALAVVSQDHDMARMALEKIKAK